MGGEGGRKKIKTREPETWIERSLGRATLARLWRRLWECLPIFTCSLSLSMFIHISLSLCLPACLRVCVQLFLVGNSRGITNNNAFVNGLGVVASVCQTHHIPWKNFGFRADAVLLIKSHVIPSCRLCWVMASISLIEKRAVTKSGFYTWQTASPTSLPPLVCP